MNLYQIVECVGKENTAGSKAVQDVVNIANMIGYEKLYVNKFTMNKSIVSKIKRQASFFIQWNSIIEYIESDSVLLLQHPFRMKQLGRNKCLKKLKEKNVKIISIVHDVEQLRKVLCNNYYIKEFAIMLQIADVIIVHNTQMEKYFRNLGVPKSKIVTLGIFDYLQNKNIYNSPQYNKTINIAGNLDLKKSPYIKQLGKLSNIYIKLFGPNYDFGMEQYSNITYGGNISPDHVPQMLTSGFGLVWDGNSIEKCCGDTGNYLKYNNPHKLSLYLSAGIPVVIWKDAAEASFVKENNVGITVTSLTDLDTIFENLTEEEYNLLVNNVKKVSNKLTEGYYTKTALSSAIKILDK